MPVANVAISVANVKSVAPNSTMGEPSSLTGDVGPAFPVVIPVGRGDAQQQLDPVMTRQRVDVWTLPQGAGTAVEAAKAISAANAAGSQEGTVASPNLGLPFHVKNFWNLLNRCHGHIVTVPRWDLVAGSPVASFCSRESFKIFKAASFCWFEPSI